MKILKRIIIILFIALLNNLMFAQDFEVAPVRIHFSAEPGQAQTRILTIKNHANRKTQFTIELVDYNVDNNGKTIQMPKGSFKNTCSEWISITPSYFDVEPNEEFQVNFSILVPPDDNSTRWTMAIIKTVKEKTGYDADKTLGAGLNVSAQIAVQIFQSPKSNQNYKAIIKDLTEIIDNKDTCRTFSAIVENKGQKVITGKVYLIAAEITTAKETQMPFIEITVLPGNSRQIKLPINKKLASGTYMLSAILDYGNKQILEGTRLKGNLIILNE